MLDIINYTLRTLLTLTTIVTFYYVIVFSFIFMINGDLFIVVGICIVFTREACKFKGPLSKGGE